MKIAIDCGHTLSGADYGAVGIKAESNLTREVGAKVINRLKALDHSVINCTIDTCNSLEKSLAYRVNQANNNNVDLFVSIHFNCFNGQAYGTEVFTWGGEQLPEAARVLNNLVELGYTNRGIKNGSNLYVIRNTKAKAMLIECCFCDNKNDMDKYDAEKIANAIVKGITGKTVPNNKENEDLIIYSNDGDRAAADLLALKLLCPVVSKNVYEYKKVNTKNIYVVGGTWKPDSNAILLSGRDRFATMQLVINYKK